MKLPKISFVLSLALCAALVFASAAGAYFENDPGSVSAPSAKPHSIYFATSGLAEGISITVSGEYTNKKDHSIPFKKSFDSPGPSQPIKIKPGSSVIQMHGYPEQYILGDTTYTLIDIAPSIPFTAGLSGDSTIVVGTYISCTLPVITGQPTSATVMAGESISLSVTLAQETSVSYQWYKDGLEISSATSSRYTIESAGASDAGIYHVVVSNLCGSVQSNPAELIVSKLSQTIDFPQPASPVVFNNSFTISPTASSGLTVTVQAAGGCQITRDLVTMTSGSLDCTLTASQPGDDYYLPADDVQHLVAAAKAGQTIDFTPPDSPAAFNTSFTVSPTATSGLTVTINATGGCQIAGNLVTMTSGSLDCLLTASQPGDNDYLPAEQVERLVAAAKADQYIDFPPPPEFAFEGLSFSVYPTASSGLAVTLTASGSCTSTGYAVTITSPPGTCILNASQVGDDNYNPAEPITHTLQTLPPANNTFYPIICLQ